MKTVLCELKKVPSEIETLAGALHFANLGPLTIEASFLVIGRVLGLRLICCAKGTTEKAYLQVVRQK